MRIKILSNPVGHIDGVAFGRFVVGSVYEFRAQMACLFLTEGWAEFVGDDETGIVVLRPPVEAANSKPLVLVVDDEPAARMFAESLLTENGYRVMAAAHGQEGIQRLREHCPDLIVLDLNMPVMSGWEFRTEQCYRTDKHCAAVPVLLLTGEDDEVKHGETLRAVGVLKKPYVPDELLEAVSAAIGSRGVAADGRRSMSGRRAGDR
jgi:CheY-like chemotaxis protein